MLRPIDQLLNSASLPILVISHEFRIENLASEILNMQNSCQFRQFESRLAISSSFRSISPQFYWTYSESPVICGWTSSIEFQRTSFEHLPDFWVVRSKDCPEFWLPFGLLFSSCLQRLFRQHRRRLYLLPGCFEWEEFGPQDRKPRVELLHSNRSRFQRIQRKRLKCHSQRQQLWMASQLFHSKQTRQLHY